MALTHEQRMALVMRWIERQCERQDLEDLPVGVTDPAARELAALIEQDAIVNVLALDNLVEGR